MGANLNSPTDDRQNAGSDPERTVPEVATDDLDAATARNTDAHDELLLALGAMLDHLTSTEDTR